MGSLPKQMFSFSHFLLEYVSRHYSKALMGTHFVIARVPTLALLQSLENAMAAHKFCFDACM